MALRECLWRIALPILLAPLASQAQQGGGGCVQDDPALVQPAPALGEGVRPGRQSDSLDVARSLSDLGNAALESDNLAAAEAYHRRALAIRQTLAPRTLAVAESLNSLGNVALERGDLAQAQAFLDDSLLLRQALAPGSREYALSLLGLGNVARRRGEMAREEAYFQQALGVGDALTPLDRADIFDGLGTACIQRTCAQKPQDYFHKALQIRQQLQPGSLGVAGTLSYLGRYEQNVGDLEESEHDFGAALELRRRLAPGSLALAATLSDQGTAARARGNLAAAELCFRQALQIRVRLAPHSLAVADSLHNLGIVFWLRNDLDGARDYLEQTLRLRRTLAPASPALAQSLIWQGLLNVGREELAEAQADFTQALALLEKSLSPASVPIAAVLSNLGNVARLRGDLTSSQDYYRRALDIQTEVARDSPAEAGTLLSLGALARQRGDLAQAETYFRAALSIQEQKVPDGAGHAAALFALGSLLRQEHKLEEAERLYTQAVDVLENQTASLGGTPEERSVFRARYENNYKDYIDLLIVRGHPEVALRVLERARARALLEMLESARVVLHSGQDRGLDRTKHSLEEEIDAKLSYRVRLLDAGHSEGQLSELGRRLSELRDRYRDTEEQIQLQNPAYAALTHPQTLTGQQVQDLLDDNTLLLEYSLNAGRSYVWAVTRTSTTVYGLPERKIIEQAAWSLRELLNARGRRVNETDMRRHERLMQADAQYPVAARELSKLVLGPVAGLLEKKRIAIISDGALQYIPFASLPPPAPDGGNEPLVMQHEVVNLPSASVLGELRRQALQRMPPSKAVAVLADPVFDRRDERIESKAAPTPGVYLDRLLWTRLEATQILKVTPPGEGLLALDFEASRATALSPLLAKYRIVHFATHAISDSEHPERSGLVLSLFDRQGRPQNGFLDLEQIYGLALPVDLVVLSACDTGLGREVGGEGLVGLVRGFMYAGSTRVMASLWSVDDEVTAQLMAHFYKGLEQDGLSPAAALRAAQLEVRKQSRWSLPYYWAGFQIEGEWRHL